MPTFKVLQLSLCAALLSATFGSGIKADEWNKKTIVTFGESVEVPGQVLPSGTYVFKLLDSSCNRHIVQIWNEDETQILATILAIPNYLVESTDRSTFEFDERPGNAPQALRVWFYPSDITGQEFVYPGYQPGDRRLR
jgi:hypothetical protein